MKKTLDISKLIICKAVLADLPYVKKIIDSHARSGTMLKKSMAYLKTHLSDYFVAKIDGIIIGTCAIKIWPSGLVEIISSAVHAYYHKKGVGSKLNRACIAYVRGLGLNKFFVLTTKRRVSFYAHLGFIRMAKSKLSAKVFTDCARCKRNRSKVRGKVICDDFAMRLTVS